MLKNTILRLLPAGFAVVFTVSVFVVFGYSVFSTSTCPAVAGDGIEYKVHDRGWIDDHGADAKMDSKSCETCHDREYCNACHFSDNPLETYHDSNYVYTHTVDRFIDKTECASCHDAESFCNSCHAAAAGRPADHLVSGWTTTGHPEPAREDLERCAVCHSEGVGDDVCLQCHRVGISPHGGDFGVELGDEPWASDPNAVCYNCHVFGES
ncbi:MAG: hypothetical protein GY771_10380 [bacterium]|nr:hypothetical protein [bacterium]